jgi:preprotein translocase subunit SecF
MAVGLLSLFQVEVNLPTIAALLTLLGYSINDTIVVFDRIREHMKKERKQEDDDLFDRSINETLSRTMITSMLTFFVVVAMLIFGGDVLYSFSFVMTTGIIVGTYSSIFVASPYVLWWNKLGVENFFARNKKRR